MERLDEIYEVIDNGSIEKMSSKELVPALVEIAKIIIGKIDKLRDMYEEQAGYIGGGDWEDFISLEDEMNSLKFDIEDDLGMFGEFAEYMLPEDVEKIKDGEWLEYNVNQWELEYKHYKDKFMDEAGIYLL